MANLGFKNFRDPVVYILNQELRKRNFKNKVEGTPPKEYKPLVEYPCRVERDSKGLVVKCIYGKDISEQWSEEIVRDSTGKVTRILVTYPGEESTRILDINRDSNKRFESITLGGI